MAHKNIPQTQKHKDLDDSQQHSANTKVWMTHNNILQT